MLAYPVQYVAHAIEHRCARTINPPPRRALAGRRNPARGDNAARDHADIFASPFFQRFGQFWDQRFYDQQPSEDAPA